MVTRTAGSVFSRQQRCLSETFHLHSYWSATSDLFVYFHFHLMNSGQRLFHQWLAFSSRWVVRWRSDKWDIWGAANQRQWRWGGERKKCKYVDEAFGNVESAAKKMGQERGNQESASRERWLNNSRHHCKHKTAGKVKKSAKVQRKSVKKWKFEGKGKNPYYRCSSQTSLCQLFLFVDH